MTIKNHNYLDDLNLHVLNSKDHDYKIVISNTPIFAVGPKSENLKGVYLTNFDIKNKIVCDLRKKKEKGNWKKKAWVQGKSRPNLTKIPHFVRTQ